MCDDCVIIVKLLVLSFDKKTATAYTTRLLSLSDQTLYFGVCPILPLLLNAVHATHGSARVRNTRACANRACLDSVEFFAHHSATLRSSTKDSGGVLSLALLWRGLRVLLQGCPKLTKRSQPLVGRSTPYYGDMWRRYCCLTSFFSIVNTCLSFEDIARQICTMVPRWRFLATFLRPVFAASHVQHISDLHSKFALGPRHV